VYIHALTVETENVASPRPPEDRESKFWFYVCKEESREVPTCNTKGSPWPFPITPTEDWLRERVGCLL